MAWLPDSRVLFVGHLVFHQVMRWCSWAPLRDERVLDWIAAFEPGHVVPGHGPLIDAAELPDVLETHRRYYVLVLDAARRGRRDGHSLLAVARRCVADIPRRGPSRTAHPLVLAT